MKKRIDTKPSMWHYYKNSDVLIALSWCIPFCLWVLFFHGNIWINSLLNENRGAVYETLASLNGSLLGFAIATATIILGYINHPNLTFARQSVRFSDIGVYFIRCIRYLGVATIISIIGLIGDRDKSPVSIILCVVVTSVSVGAVSLIRTLVLFQEILTNVFQPEQRPSLPTQFSSLSDENNSA